MFDNTIFIPGDESRLEDELIGRRITGADNDAGTLTLDNGTVLDITPNEGCICGSGDYYLEYLKDFDNVITHVQPNEMYTDDGPYYEEKTYTLFVYTEGINYAEGVNAGHSVLKVTGDDGNGYYGTGYSITVKKPAQEVTGQ